MQNGSFNGKDGQDGKDGQNGQSAYELAVKNGFQGTEAEWLESLKYDHSEEFSQLSTQIQGYKTDAESAAESAESSAQSASESATNAEQSKQSALEGAESAKQSAQSAKEGAESALQASNSASESAKSASDAANSASGSATSAEQSAQSASNSALSASESAQSASESAQSASEAKTYAEQASAYATQAEASATKSEQEANRAEDIANSIQNYVDVEDMIEKLAIKQTSEGNPTIINDSAEWRLQSLNVYGQSSQDGTPSPENPVDIISKEVSEIKVTNGADLSQTITLTEPITLRGIPVESGGNVTIDGQQYVVDEICEKDGVIGVERSVIDLRASDGIIFKQTPDNPNRVIGDMAFNALSSIKNGSEKSLSTHFVWKAWGLGDNNKEWVFGVSGIAMYISPPAKEGGYTKEELESLVNSEWTKIKNDVKFSAQLSNPTFEPLSEEVQAQYKALKSYYPNTVIQTGCWTEVGYVADTKKYIDDKLTAIASQMIDSKIKT